MKIIILAFFLIPIMVLSQVTIYTSGTSVKADNEQLYVGMFSETSLFLGMPTIISTGQRLKPGNNTSDLLYQASGINGTILNSKYFAFKKGVIFHDAVGKGIANSDNGPVIIGMAGSFTDTALNGGFDAFIGTVGPGNNVFNAGVIDLEGGTEFVSCGIKSNFFTNRYYIVGTNDNQIDNSKRSIFVISCNYNASEVYWSKEYSIIESTDTLVSFVSSIYESPLDGSLYIFGMGKAFSPPNGMGVIVKLNTDGSLNFCENFLSDQIFTDVIITDVLEYNSQLYFLYNLSSGASGIAWGAYDTIVNSFNILGNRSFVIPTNNIFIPNSTVATSMKAIYNPISMEGELIICGTSRNGFTTNHNGFWIRTSLSGDLLDGLILDTYPYNFINKLDLYQTPSETYLALFGYIVNTEAAMSNTNGLTILSKTEDLIPSCNSQLSEIEFSNQFFERTALETSTSSKNHITTHYKCKGKNVGSEILCSATERVASQQFSTDNNSALIITPNPAHNYIQLILDESLIPEKIEVYNLVGDLIYKI